MPHNMLRGISVFLFGFIVWYGIIKPWNTISNDFPNYYVSSQIVINESNYAILYNDSLFNDYVSRFGITQPSKFSQYPPVTSLIMIPLTPFEPVTAKQIWTILNVLMLIGCIYLTSSLFSISIAESVLLFSFTGFSLINNFAFGQFYICLLLIILLSVFAYKKGYYVLSAALLGFGTVIKIIPVIFIIWLILNRKWKMVLFCLVSVLLVMSAEVMIFGLDIPVSYWFGTFMQHLQSNLIQQNPYAYSFQSWDSLFHNLFTANATYNPNPLFDSPLVFSMAKVAVLITILASSAFALNFKEKHVSFSNRSFLILCVAVLLMLPASATYHFVLLIIPGAIILKADYFSLTIKYVLISLIFLIGYIPIHFVNNLDFSSVFVVFHYPRLILLTAIFTVLIIHSARYKNREAA